MVTADHGFINPLEVLVSTIPAGIAASRGPMFTGPLRPLSYLADEIRGSETLARLTRQARGELARSGRSHRYDSLKLAMPAFIPASHAPDGSPVRGLPVRLHHNGLYGFDIDEGRDSMDPSAVRQSLIAAPGMVAVGLSCGGDALWCLAAGPQAGSSQEYRSNWQAISAGLPPSAAAASGQASKNFNRLRTLAYDPAFWLADGPVPRLGRSLHSPIPADDDPVSLREALGWLSPPRDYNQWLGWLPVLRALGFTAEEVEAWSSSGTGYQPGEVTTRWNGLPADEPRSALDRLRGAAWAAGWRPSSAGPSRSSRPSPNRSAPPTVSAEDVRAALPSEYVGMGPPYGVVDCAPFAAAMRLLLAHDQSLLLAYDSDRRADVYGTDKSGVWRREWDGTCKALAADARDWAAKGAELASAGLISTKAAGDALRYARRLQTPEGAREVFEMTSPALLELRSLGREPEGITTCLSRDLDSRKHYIGAPNCVVDLRDGRLITGPEARACLVTRMLPDPVILGLERHPLASRLLDRLPAEVANFLVDSLAWSLHGIPARRIVVLEGPGGAGKTTLLGAFRAAVGEDPETGYGFSLSNNALVADRFSSANGHSEHLLGFPVCRIATAADLPDRKLDTSLLKTVSGGDGLPVRGIRERTRSVRAATATLFISLNPGVLGNFDLSDEALADRIFVLPYPALPQEEHDALLLEQIQTDPAARQSLVSLLLSRSFAMVRPPDPPALVVEATSEGVRAALGDFGELVRRIKPGPPDSRLWTGDVWQLALELSGPREDGLPWGESRKGLIKRLVRALGLPPVQRGRHPESREPERYWPGYRLVEPDAVSESYWLAL